MENSRAHQCCSPRRTPSWTDRVLYATHTDSPYSPEESHIENLLYTSIPSYTTSDHVRAFLNNLPLNLTVHFQKPIVSLLLLPPATPSTDGTSPILRLPPSYQPRPDPWARFKRYGGRLLDRVLGYIWCLLVLFGAGSSVVGLCNFFLGLGAWKWWWSDRHQLPSERE